MQGLKCPFLAYSDPRIRFSGNTRNMKASKTSNILSFQHLRKIHHNASIPHLSENMPETPQKQAKINENALKKSKQPPRNRAGFMLFGRRKETQRENSQISALYRNALQNEKSGDFLLPPTGMAQKKCRQTMLPATL